MADLLHVIGEALEAYWVSPLSLSVLAAAAIICLLVWQYGNAAVIRKFNPRKPAPDEAWLQQYVDLLGKFERVPGVRVRIVESNDALAMAVGGAHQTILVSSGLL